LAHPYFSSTLFGKHQIEEVNLDHFKVLIRNDTRQNGQNSGIQEGFKEDVLMRSSLAIATANFIVSQELDPS
jgi:hypothetical protein